jgi:hypothetical protein
MSRATKNVTSADNQQERLIAAKLRSAYLSGFIDGEGCFYVGIVPTKFHRLGWQVICEFRVSQNPKGKAILKELKRELNCGYIKPNHPGNLRDKTWVFMVRNKNDLREKVIPFFKENPLRTGKKDDLEKFVKVLGMVENNRHFYKTGLLEIVDVAYSMNQKGPRRKSRSFIAASLK